jgi:FMN phosphatase YigB (HAD superfamily)
MSSPKNIIFDLGGVLLDIDFRLTHQAFERAGVPGFDKLYSQHAASPFFIDFEKGKVPVSAFYDHIRAICHCPLSNDTIRDCWNALLKNGFEQEKINWLKQAAQRYRIFLLSNTNIIHYDWFSADFKRLDGNDFNDCFVKAYYSHEMGLRKPDAESFQYILDEQKLEAGETLFIDDTIKNIEAAARLGLATIHLPAPGLILDLDL